EEGQEQKLHEERSGTAEPPPERLSPREPLLGEKQTEEWHLEARSLLADEIENREQRRYGAPDPNEPGEARRHRSSTPADSSVRKMPGKLSRTSMDTKRTPRARILRARSCLRASAFSRRTESSLGVSQMPRSSRVSTSTN